MAALPFSIFLAASPNFIVLSWATTVFAFPRAAFLYVDFLEPLGNKLHFGLGDCAEHAAVNVVDAALVFDVRQYRSHSLKHTEAFVSNDVLDALQETVTPILEMGAGFVVELAAGRRAYLASPESFFHAAAHEILDFPP